MPEIADWPEEPAEQEARRRRRFDASSRSPGVGLCEGEHFVAAETGAWKAVAPHPDASETTHPIWPALVDLETDPAEASPLTCEGTAWERLAAAVDRLIGSAPSRSQPAARPTWTRPPPPASKPGVLT